MRSRRWIGILALIGVLLHAGAIVRHNAAMTGANLQYQALLTGLAQLCHSGATGEVLAADLPFVPKPTDAQNGCPICSGLSPAVALVAPEFDVAFLAMSEPLSFLPDTSRLAGCSYAVCPPARGPPAFA